MASTSSFSASSPSNFSIVAPKRYDVFLSFRGEDTRYNFTDHLYQALIKRGIRTFRDDKLRRGEAIAYELLNAIEDSRSSIIVFSEKYAHSRWCLDELVNIMDVGHTVFPIFYHVDPSHVRNQTGPFGEAFAGYQENWKEKVGRWRTALTEAGNLSGWHLQDEYETNFINGVVNSIECKLNCKRVDINTNLVGVDCRVEELLLRMHMESNDVRMVGVYGLGGIGKSTVAKDIYNRLSTKFEYMSFLEYDSEVSNTKGLRQLQSQLVSDILGEDRKQYTMNGGLGNKVRMSLCSKKVFIVFDNFDYDQDLIEFLNQIRKCLGNGSRVIITTRDKRLLTSLVVDDMYEVPLLIGIDAYKLFCLHAFKQEWLDEKFLYFVSDIIFYCKGLPIALKEMGFLFCNRTVPRWTSELKKLKSRPETKFHEVLKRSYDGLVDSDKDILLDVACFFKVENEDLDVRILNCCNDFPVSGIENLTDKCLITITDDEIRMHKLIQKMCWEIVREKFPTDPHKWSRLWDPCDIARALRACEELHGVETISLDLSMLKSFKPNVLAKMTRLRLLKVHYGFLSYSDFGEDKDYYAVVATASKMKFGMDFKFPYELRYLCWDGFPLEFLPFYGEDLIELHLKCSNIKQLWQEKKNLERLKVIDMSHSKKLIQMLEFSSMPNLEEVFLCGCVSLIDIHLSIGVLKKLTTLDLRWCDQLKGLPSSIINLEALVVLNLSGCSRFEKFPEVLGNMGSLRYLYLDQTAIRELPNGCNLESVEVLDLSNCLNFQKFPENGANMKSLIELRLKNTVLKELPTGIAYWQSLPILDLSRCPKFEKFPEVGNMKSLKKLLLMNTAIKDLPNSIGNLELLEVLDLSYCFKFEKFPEVGSMKSLNKLLFKYTAIKHLPNSIGNLESLEFLDLSYCSKFEKFPEVGNMKSLKKLLLMNTAIKDLPNSIGNLELLQVLDLSNCKKFCKFPEKVENMKSLKLLYLRSTAIVHLPDSVRDLASLWMLDLSYCNEFEKFPETERLKNLGLPQCYFRITKSGNA